jgi:cephalosporin-C deacetylase-like acetyl esterase
MVNVLHISAKTQKRCVSRALRRGAHATVAVLILTMLVIPIPSWAARQISNSPAGAGHAVSDPQSIEDFYTYDSRHPLEPRIAMLDSNEWYQHYDLQYQSEGDTVYSHYFVPVLPRSAGNPAIIGLHGMFSDSEQQFWMMAEFVAKRGIAGITPSMPYHHRRSKGVQLFSGQKFIVDSPQAIRDNIRRAVIDVRRALDWLSQRPEIDPDSVSMAGASLGGIVASLSYKVEPRFRTGVFVMAGSGVTGIAENSEHLLVAAFREIAKTKLLDPQNFVDTLRPVDPINVPDLYPRPVLMINGAKDTIMPPSESIELLRSLGQAEQVWADSSHYFPAYVAEYLLASFLAEHMPESYGVPAPGSVLQAQPGWRFVEAVQPPVPGENRLWVNVEAQAPAAGTSSAHRVGVPMVNKVVPVIAVSADTLGAVETDLLKLPAFIHVMASDSLFDLAAACAYASALELGHEPLLYYLAPSAALADPSSADGSIATEHYTLMEFSAAHVELARPATAAVVVPAASAAPAASLPSPHDLCTSSATYSSASAAVAALASGIRWNKLKTLPHFENAPDEWPTWSYSSPGVSYNTGSTP